MSEITARLTIEMPEPSGYGASELKDFINKNTLRGFLITLGLTIILLLIYVFAVQSSSGAKAAPKMAPLAKVRLDDLAPQTNEAMEAPPPVQQIVNTGPAARAGNPIPVPDAQITAEMKDFATIDVMSRASSAGGDGLDLGGFAANIDLGERVVVQTRVEEPAPDAFIPVEKEPGVDLAKLQKIIKYPELARRAGVEGKVIIRVLVDEKGKARRQLIEFSDNELLNQAAMDAVNDYGTFTPAIQNAQPIMCWVSIPIQFKLR
ncbi:MAG: energy transducer TonB [Candidatus Kapabacteria bacterium]|nr:energy transducer TonB [Candidatus Kapabacteria bacterium]